MLRGFNDRPEGSDKTPSGKVQQCVSIYPIAADKPSWDEAVSLSIRAEGFDLRKQPPGKRKPKHRKWHVDNVNNSLKLRTNKSSEERMVFKAKGEKYAETEQEDRILQALKYARAEKMQPRDYVFYLEVISQSSGRSRFQLTDGVIAERTGMNESSVTRAKKSFRNSYGAVLVIDRNRYRIIE